MPEAEVDAPIVIRRYARSRFYDAAGKRYVSLDTLRAWKGKALAFTVLDVETGEDVTRVLLV